ncbi:Protein DA1 [Platanthera guangdongensis]|uniref:Protein DA1 n=1 Tax=Platanthera guangdongensis TaxID=2320717 RepID=A0ABR2MWX7_9ASPA
MDVVWHRGCFRCYACDQPIVGQDFWIYEDHPYHMSCGRNLYQHKCDVCKAFVSVKHCLPSDHWVLPIWMQRTCDSHQHDGTHYCFSCHRKQPQGAKYIRLDDKVMSCPECFESSIMDIVQCQPLYRDIQKFYKSLNMEIDQKIPLHLVESGVIRSKLPREQIYIYLLCRITAGSHLAHEMMHAWLRLNGYKMLDPHVEEGICSVMSYMWLDFEMTSGSGSNVASSSSPSSSIPYRNSQRSKFEKKLAEYCIYYVKNRKLPIYGDGFREGYAAVLKYGLKNVLNHIKLKGRFPC